ncbi:hypothetical protein [Paenibacillus sp. YYML68]|uniref:hypothetical protein n=1 Tax=Paenibacillus sp. YYML68 TaxID=2909250 RepID=UPI002490E122|nr:hypothetical protein [Paenibacillus sp. YYML68]
MPPRKKIVIASSNSANATEDAPAASVAEHVTVSDAKTITTTKRSPRRKAAASALEVQAEGNARLEKELTSSTPASQRTRSGTGMRRKRTATSTELVVEPIVEPAVAPTGEPAIAPAELPVVEPAAESSAQPVGEPSLQSAPPAEAQTMTPPATLARKRGRKPRAAVVTDPASQPHHSSEASGADATDRPDSLNAEHVNEDADHSNTFVLEARDSQTNDSIALPSDIDSDGLSLMLGGPLKKKQRKDTHEKSRMHIRKDLMERLEKLAEGRSKGFKTLLLNYGLEKALDELEQAEAARRGSTDGDIDTNDSNDSGSGSNSEISHSDSSNS